MFADAEQATPTLYANWHTRMSDFGGVLARLMTERGIGVRQLARALYVNPGHVSNLRSGKARPSCRT